ncbi:MAG: TonB-dependent receptor plug domain-containing protein [Caldithrix sp.]|nr:TonB-dependent receptor plug domain-containing protein [Caldithrix sp.]
MPFKKEPSIMKNHQVSFYLLIGLIFPLHAITPADTTSVYDMQDSIVVVANRYQTSLKNIPYSYEVISSEEVQLVSNHSALEVVDKYFPSAFILEKKVMGYGVGTAGSGQVYLRGQGGHPNTGVLVLLNGHPDFMGLFGHPLPDVYGKDNIQQVEILAGPASTVFGDHAMGGVVNLVTGANYKHPFQVQMEGGSYGTANFSVKMAKRLGNTGLHISARRQQTDGHIANTSFQSYHLQAGFSHQINDRWEFSVSGRFVPYEFDDPSRGNADVADIGTFGKIRRGTGEMILKNKGKKLTGSTQIYTNLGHHLFFDGFDAHDYTYGFSSYQFMNVSSQWNVAAGIDLLHYGGRAQNSFAKLPNGQPIVNNDLHTISSAGLYALAFYNPIPRLNLKSGLRYHYNSLPASNVSPVAGITLDLHPMLQLFSNYQQGFRSPTPRDLYLFPSANENLDAENIKSIEFGTAFRWSIENKIRFSYYYNDVENMIQLMPNLSPPPRSLFQNSGRAFQHGYEMQLSYNPTMTWNFQLAYSYMDPDELTAYNPEQQLKYNIKYTVQKARLAVFGKFVDGLYAGNNSQSPLPDYHVMNASVSLVNKRFDTSFKVFNILGKTYYVLPEYPAPGTHARIGINYKW